MKPDANDRHARSAAPPSRGPPPPSLGEQWPAVALLLVLVAAGVGMGVIAIRHMNALQRDGTTSRYAVVLQVGTPAMIGGASRSAWSTYLLASLIPLVPAAIVGFGALLLSADTEGTRHRGKPPSRITPPTDPPDAGLE